MTEKLYDLLCPPGAGVYTVNTAKDKKIALHRYLYQSIDSIAVNNKYKQTLSNFFETEQVSSVAMIGICSDTGGGIQRGANWGPLFIREKIQQGNASKIYTDLGDVRVIPHLLHDKYLNEDTIKTCQKALYQREVDLPVSPLSIAHNALETIYTHKPSIRLFGLGGDHSVSYPLLKTYLSSKKQQGIKCGLIHFDAHTDLLKSRLGIDLCFGSWLTHVLADFECPSHIAQLGIRSTAKSKEHWQSTFGIKQYWANEIRQQGIEHFCHQIIESFKSKNIEEIYITFDIDALDSSIASATGTPEPEGLMLDDVLIAIALFRASFAITGADLVEVAPLVNPYHQINEPESTLLAAKRISEALLHAMHHS